MHMLHLRIGITLTAGWFVCGTAMAEPLAISPPKLGFQCLPVPSSWMEPGSVFSVDQSGTTYRIGKVPGITASAPGAAGFPSYSSTAVLNVGLLFSTLAAFTKVTGWDAQVGANGGNNVSVTTSYAKPQLVMTEGQPERLAAAWFGKSGYRIEDGFRYFLVREALMANNAAYEFKQADVGKLGGEASVRNMIKGSVDLIDSKSTSSYVLKATFDKLLNVCIKPRELVVLSYAASGVQKLRTKDVVEPIQITRIGEQ